jgi:hypothetical protein
MPFAHVEPSGLLEQWSIGFSRHSTAPSLQPPLFAPLFCFFFRRAGLQSDSEVEEVFFSAYFEHCELEIEP